MSVSDVRHIMADWYGGGFGSSRAGANLTRLAARNHTFSGAV
jgi:hypothetical protein